jgi:hypothetical protein
MTGTNDVAAQPHGDDHTLLRNEWSGVEHTKSPKKIPEDNVPEDSSESTDYENSSLIESFHTQLAFQADSGRTLSCQDLNREITETPLDPYEPVKGRRGEWTPGMIDQIEGRSTRKDKEVQTEPILDLREPGDDPCNCTSAKATCWEQSQYTWKEHVERCDKCHEWAHRECPTYGKNNQILSGIYERISQSKGH